MEDTEASPNQGGGGGVVRLGLPISEREEGRGEKNFLKSLLNAKPFMTDLPEGSQMKIRGLGVAAPGDSCGASGQSCREVEGAAWAWLPVAEGGSPGLSPPGEGVLDWDGWGLLKLLWGPGF